MSNIINVYEKEADLSEVILGIGNDPKRIQFDEIVKVLEGYGYTVNRYDPIHNREMMKAGIAYPSVYLDETVLSAGYYPSVDDISQALDLDSKIFSEVSRTTILHDANTTRLGACCGVGQDIYCDPNEDDLWK